MPVFAGAFLVSPPSLLLILSFFLPLYLTRSYNAVIERTGDWEDAFETEPCKVGWTSESEYLQLQR